MVWPDIDGEWRQVDRRPDRTARDAAYAVFKGLDDLDWRAVRAQRDRGPNGDEDGPPFLRLSLDAHHEFVLWRTALEQRLAWANYLDTHARRAYGSVTAAESDTARAILSRIKSGHLMRQFTARDVRRPGWSRLTDRPAVQGGLEMLVDYEWLTSCRIETGGRPYTLYRVADAATI